MACSIKREEWLKTDAALQDAIKAEEDAKVAAATAAAALVAADQALVEAEAERASSAQVADDAYSDYINCVNGVSSPTPKA